MSEAPQFYHFRVEAPDNIVGQWILFWYLMKNLNETLTPAEMEQHGATTAARLYGIGFRPPKQSDAVLLKRIRIATALNTKAQQAMRYRPQHDIADNTSPAFERYSDAEFQRGRTWRAQQEMVHALRDMDWIRL